jgi:hypothetical protein
VTASTLRLESQPQVFSDGKMGKNICDLKRARQTHPRDAVWWERSDFNASEVDTA